MLFSFVGSLVRSSRLLSRCGGFLFGRLRADDDVLHNRLQITVGEQPKEVVDLVVDSFATLLFRNLFGLNALPWSKASQAKRRAFATSHSPPASRRFVSRAAALLLRSPWIDARSPQEQLRPAQINPQVRSFPS